MLGLNRIFNAVYANSDADRGSKDYVITTHVIYVHKL